MIEFILNNEIVKTDVKSGMTLLHFIREIKGIKGTKSGCKEGDCGACTVLIGTLQKNGTVNYESLTSCLTPMANVKNKHIVTIEGLNLNGKLNISQLAIKEHHGTQCGFCTPGFVVSLSGFVLDNNVDKKVIDHLSGNICRCTGYKSIEKAAKSVEEQLKNKNINNDLDWLINNMFVPDYFREISEKLKKVNSILLENGSTLVGGGTDLYVRYADKLTDENINTDKLEIETGIVFKESKCTIGAAATVSDLKNNLVLNKYFPNLQKHLKLISSKQIRNMGTVAGNFVNASPIGDMSIFFLALDSNLEIVNKDGQIRIVSLKTFFKDYKLFDLKDNEIIKNISFNLPDKAYFNFEKVSKRTHLDIASVNSAMSIRINDNKILDASISIGGVAAIPKYLFKTNKFLRGKILSNQTVKDAQEIMQNEISPISDVRGTVQYKRLLARQLFYAHFLELFQDKIVLNDLINN